ncbi:unnamed protein product [Durusdinium trenchii]|uniref:Uncharacterized protein n=1 Tax=Durusdinium trenchii TaxID=1381693 RepID=A0ABP0KHZ6_9DINO
MGKVKKTHLKNKKAKAKAQGKKTEADGDEVLDAGETSHELKRRHAAERKALQAKIVELKRQRKKLPKKKNKDDKKALTEEMKKLKSEMKLEHQMSYGKDMMMNCRRLVSKWKRTGILKKINT